MEAIIENQVTAMGLKQVLWETILAIRDKTLKPDAAHAVAKSANAILKTVQLEFDIGRNYHLQSTSLKNFVLIEGDKLPALPGTAEKKEKQLRATANEEPKRH